MKMIKYYIQRETGREEEEEEELKQKLFIIER